MKDAKKNFKEFIKKLTEIADKQIPDNAEAILLRIEGSKEWNILFCKNTGCDLEAKLDKGNMLEEYTNYVDVIMESTEIDKNGNIVILDTCDCIS